MKRLSARASGTGRGWTNCPGRWQRPQAGRQPEAYPKRVRILILGGTGEARELAAALVAAGTDVISSLAGRVRRPRLPDGPVRVGGFGGAEGLAAFLGEENITHVVDATHPFAGTITANAGRAAQEAGVPLLVLRRPGWEADPSWRSVADIRGAAEAVARWPGQDV